FDLKGGSVWGLGGPVIGSDGTLYVQTSNALLALGPKDLRLRHTWPLPGGSTSRTSKELDMNVPSPAVFNYKGRDLIVATTRHARLLLLEPTAQEPLYQTPRVSVSENSVDHGVWGGISTWEDSDGTRSVLAPVWGQLASDLRVPTANGTASNGSIVAFKVEVQ